MKTKPTIAKQFTAILTTALLLSSGASGWGLPEVENVPNGNVTFDTSQIDTLNITASDNSIIHYHSFDIGSTETVEFIQPNSSARVLNRVTATDNPSDILGTLKANGQVYLVNPAGIIFGQNAIVDVGALYAAAGQISDNNYLNGINNFSDLNRINGSIGVENKGTITATDTIFLGAGDKYSVAIRNTGILKAPNTIHIEGSRNNIVEIEGTLDASNTATGQIGGDIKVLSDEVDIHNANLNASGEAGGGTIRVGGDYQGSNPNILNASYTNVSSSTNLVANATTQGNGGRIIVWADESTSFAGSITATGGALSGDGGFAEVSGKNYLEYQGSAILTAPNGETGTLLLDPETITIGTTTTNDSELSDQQILFSDSTGSSFNISATEVVNSLNTANTLLQANQTITVDSTIDARSGAANDLTLEVGAGGNIVLNSDIRLEESGAKLTLNGNVTLGSNVTLGGNTGIVSGTIDGGHSLSWDFNPGTLTLGGAVGNSTPLSSINSNATTLVINGGRMTTTGDQRYQGGNIMEIDSSDNETHLVSTGSGAILVGQATSFLVKSVTAGEDALIVNTAGETNIRARLGFGGQILSEFTTTGGGTTVLQGIELNTSGNQTYNDAITFGSQNMTLTSSSGGNITFNSTVDSGGGFGSKALNVNTSGTTTFTAAVGSEVAMSSVSTYGGGSTNIGANITTANGAITFNDSVSLTGNSTVDAGTATLSFNNTVDGAFTLTLNSSGNTNLNAAIGSTTPLASLTTNSGGTTYLLSNIATNNGNITFNDPVALNSSGTLNAGTAHIIFSNTLAQNDGGLTLEAIASTVTLNGSASVSTLNGSSSSDRFIFGNGVTLTGNLNMGDGDDTIQFGDSAAIGGTLVGGLGNDVLNYSNNTTGVTLNLQNNTVTTSGTISESEPIIEGSQIILVPQINISTSISGFETFIGGSGQDTLIAQNLPNSWTLNSNNSGTLSNANGLFTFSNTDNLTGGSDTDTFTFSNNGSLSGSLDGSSGFDTLDTLGHTNNPLGIHFAGNGSIDGLSGSINAFSISNRFDNISIFIPSDGGSVFSDLLKLPQQEVLTEAIGYTAPLSPGKSEVDTLIQSYFGADAEVLAGELMEMRSAMNQALENYSSFTEQPTPLGFRSYLEQSEELSVESQALDYLINLQNILQNFALWTLSPNERAFLHQIFLRVFPLPGFTEEILKAPLI